MSERLFILSYEDDEGAAWPEGVFSTLEKAQNYAQKDWDDTASILESALEWSYDEPSGTWSSDSGELQWYVIKETVLDPEREDDE